MVEAKGRNVDISGWWRVLLEAISQSAVCTCIISTAENNNVKIEWLIDRRQEAPTTGKNNNGWEIDQISSLKFKKGEAKIIVIVY